MSGRSGSSGADDTQPNGSLREKEEKGPTIEQLFGEDSEDSEPECSGKIGGAIKLLQMTFDHRVEYSDNSFRTLIEKSPPEVFLAKHKLSCYAPGGIFGFKAHALLGALGHEYSADTMNLLCDKCPDEALKDTDVEGRTPLHVACQRKGDEIVKLLATRHPSSLNVTTWRCLKTPLNVACEAARSLSLIQWLVDTCPESLAKTSRRGHTPFHTACLHGSSLDVVQYLLRKRPESIKEVTKFGSTALHLVASMPQEPLQCRIVDPVFDTSMQLDLIRYLAKQHPKALHQKDGEGHCPLECALSAEAADCNGGAVRLLKALQMKHTFFGVCRVKLCLIRARKRMFRPGGSGYHRCKRDFEAFIGGSKVND